MRAKSGFGEERAERDGLGKEQVMSQVEVDLRGRGSGGGGGDIPEEGEGVGFDDGASWIGVPSLAGDWEIEQGEPAPAEASGEEETGSEEDVSSEETDHDEEESEVDEGESTVSAIVDPMGVITEEDQVEVPAKEGQSDGKPPRPSLLPHPLPPCSACIQLNVAPLDKLDVSDAMETDTEDEEEEVLGVVF